MKFTDKELLILDEIKPFIDFEYVEERKGRCQSYPVLHLLDSETYWCELANDMLPIPSSLVGDWILTSTYDEEYTEWGDIRDCSQWESAEYKEVCEMKWVAK